MILSISQHKKAAFFIRNQTKYWSDCDVNSCIHTRKGMLHGDENKPGLQLVLQESKKDHSEHESVEIETHMISKQESRVVVCGRFTAADVAIKLRKKMKRRVEILEIQDFPDAADSHN